MNKKMILSSILIILPIISQPMETNTAICDEPAIVVAWCKNKGCKDYEDRFFYDYIPEKGHICGLADGHCGSKTADYISKNVVSQIAEQKSNNASANVLQALLALDAQVKDFEDGSTAIVVNIVNDKESTSKGLTCHIANVGDSRVVLGRIAKEKYTVSFYTHDHKPHGNELERILSAGGFVSETGYVRADLFRGGLAMTRSIGDYHYDPEKKVIIATPECTTIHIPDVSDEDFLVLATDGLWDYCMNWDSEDTFSQDLFSIMSKSRSADNNLVTIAKKLVMDAVEKKSSDDITCMLISIKALTENKKATMQEIEMKRSALLSSSCDRKIRDN